VFGYCAEPQGHIIVKEYEGFVSIGGEMRIFLAGNKKFRPESAILTVFY
jgi:hypothetical protein